jgi:DNA mismatch repair protein MutL
MDVIRLLSDSIANQIAAGEVIQRPASAVKELIENAVDAGADRIRVDIRDAGRSMIQVCDNGKGMSETDARMAFERHATSKISTAQDLFSLQTMGFRGEALASIAAVAQVELKTKRKEDETGTMLCISGSQVERHEPVAATEGSVFTVKNLFFNVPARRKFLKSNETEFKNILTEFERIALVNTGISFSLYHNDVEVYNLPASNNKQRIVSIYGKKLSQQLIPVNVTTSLVNLSGFIGNPESAKKRGAHQFFFVNGRYMRHPYFHKAVMMAFEPYIPAGFQPNYFIYLQVSPDTIDVNIHPTKTEIKFENERAIWHIITQAVKEAIAVPSLEFDREGAFEMPVFKENKPSASMPQVSLRSDYNPFREHNPATFGKTDWQQLYEQPLDNGELIAPQEQPESEPMLRDETPAEFLSYKGKYLIVSLPPGLTIIEQRRAHIRILFDEYIRKIDRKQGLSQGLLFPEMITFTAREATTLPYLWDDFASMGFDLADLGNNAYSINGVPEGLDNVDAGEVLQEMVDKVLETGCEVAEEVSETLALTLAKKSAIPSGKVLLGDEANKLITQLFASSSPHYTPDGKAITWLLTEDELARRFK